MKTFAFALACSFALASYAAADEFMVIITKVEGTTVTFKRIWGKLEQPKNANQAAKVESTANMGANAKVAIGQVDLGDAGFGKKGGNAGKSLILKTGDVIEGGINNPMFKKIDDKGLVGQVTTNDRGEITQLLILANKNPKKGKSE